MDEPTDPLARQLALSALTTEQFNLQTARMGTIAEANGRSTLYLGALSSTVIAIAFVGQASELGDAFYLFALSLLPPVFLLGVFSYLRLVQTSIEDMVYAVGSFRIRQYFLGLDPTAVPFFPPTDPQRMTKLERIGVVATGPLQLLLTAAGMVGCINAIVGGVAVALALRSLLAAPVPVAAVIGTLVALGWRCCASPTRSGASVGQRPWSRSCTRARVRACRDGPSTPNGGRHSSASGLSPTVGGNQARPGMPPKAARTAGPPRTRPRRCINRAKRTARRVRPPRGTELDRCGHAGMGGVRHWRA
jgi:hypothetical protein